MRKKLLKLVSLCAVLVLALGVASAQESTEEADCNFADDPVVIGGLAPLSAPGAVTAGVAMEWSMEQAVEDINADCGITMDGMNYRLQIEVEDSEGSTAPAQLAAERLIESSNVVGVVGVYHSAVGLATMDIFQDNQIPVVYSEPWNDNVTIEGLERFEEDGIELELKSL